MKKMYVVVNDWSNECGGNVDMIRINLFSTYEKAKEYFEKEKQKIISYDLNYNDKEESKDYYCEWESGEYLYYHELVYIKELEIDKGCGE